MLHKKFVDDFTDEEKILCLVAPVAFYIDILSTFLHAKTYTTLMVYEMNTLLKDVASIGVSAIFKYMCFVPTILFLASVIVVIITKYYKMDRVYIYAIMFMYLGFRLDGAASWIGSQF